MASQLKRYTLGAAVTVVGFLAVACGTTGSGLPGPSVPNLIIGSTGTGTAGTAGTAGTTGTTSAGITGGITKTPVVNQSFPPTTPTVTITDMLPTTNSSGGTNAVTRLGLGFFGGTILGTRAVCVQGNGLGIGLGNVTLMPENPNTTTPGTGDVVLTASALGISGSNTQSLSRPFGLLVNGSNIFVTDNFGQALTGRVVVINNVVAPSSNAATTTTANFNQIGNANMQNPIAMALDTTVTPNFLYVAQYATAGGNQGGSVIRINLTTGAQDTNPYIQNLSKPSSLALDTSNGHKYLYVAENSGGGSGANGGIYRFDMSTFVAGNSPLTGNTPNTGVTIIQPQTNDPAYTNPFDMAVDRFGNVVFDEGLTYDVAGATFTGGANGKIRVIAGGTTPSVTSRLVLLAGSSASSTLVSPRGISIFDEDGTGGNVTTFFTDGAAGNSGNVHQLTFQVTTGAIYNHFLLATALLNPLDTLFDIGSTVPSVKVAISFLGGLSGGVKDIR